MFFEGGFIAAAGCSTGSIDLGGGAVSKAPCSTTGDEAGAAGKVGDEAVGVA